MGDKGTSIGDRLTEQDIEEHSEPFIIGDADTWANAEATIDEVAVYDYALTWQQIVAHFNTGSSVTAHGEGGAADDG